MCAFQNAVILWLVFNRIFQFLNSWFHSGMEWGHNWNFEIYANLIQKISPFRSEPFFLFQIEVKCTIFTLRFLCAYHCSLLLLLLWLVLFGTTFNCHRDNMCSMMIYLPVLRTRAKFNWNVLSFILWKKLRVWKIFLR